MFANTAEAVNNRLNLCKELMQMHYRAEHNPEALKSYKALTKFKKKKNVLRCMITGTFSNQIDALLASESHSISYFNTLMDQYNLESDVAKKTKILYELKSFTTALYYNTLDDETVKNSNFFMKSMVDSLNQKIKDNSVDISQTIDYIQKNSKIKGLFNVQKGLELFNKRKELQDEHKKSTQELIIRLSNDFREMISKINKLNSDFKKAADGIDDPIEKEKIREKYAVQAQLLRDKHGKAKASAIAENDQEYLPKIDVITQHIVGMAQNIREAVIEQSSVKREEAKKWVLEQVKITQAVKNKCKKHNISLEEFSQSLQDFYILTNGRLGNICIDTKNHNRAFAMHIQEHNVEGLVMLDNDFSMKVLWHELAHHIESDDGIRALAQNYIQSRSIDGSKVHKLSELTKNSNYGANEVAYKTDMFNHYAAKIYKSGDTELFSMSVEVFYDPETLFNTMIKDSKTIEFSTAVLMMEKSKADVINKELRDTLVNTNVEAKNDEYQNILKQVGELAQSVKFTQATFKISDLPESDALVFTEKMKAKPYGELLLPDGTHFYLLSSSKVKYNFFSGRAMKGVFALIVNDLKKVIEMEVRNNFISQHGYVKKGNGYSIQTQDLEKIKALTLIMHLSGNVANIADTKGEIGEGYLTPRFINQIQSKLKGVNIQ